LPTNFFNIAFHFLVSLQFFIVSYCTYNQRSVVSALLATSKQDSVIASRDYMMFTWCLWQFLLYAPSYWFRGIAPPPIAECTYEMEKCNTYQVWSWSLVNENALAQ
jgi:hypothetical protein